MNQHGSPAGLDSESIRGYSDELHCFVPTTKRLEPTQDGILRGKTFVIKDLVAVKGHTSSFGHSKWRETHSPSDQNGWLLDTLLANGASMVGITKLDQIAYSIIGNIGEGEPPINSLYPDRFTGGSSSGSASAVAGGKADFGIGTDTGGSIRVPAAACGLFSIRPTHSIIDKRGVIPLAQSLDVVGILSTDAETLSRVLSVLTENMQQRMGDITRIIVPQEEDRRVDKQLFDLVEKMAVLLSSKLEIPIDFVDVSEYVSSTIADLFPRIQGREIWLNHHEWVEANKQFLAEDVQVRLDRCKLWSMASESEKSEDEKMRFDYSNKLQNLVGKSSILVFPILPTFIPPRSSTLEALREFRTRSIPFIAPASLSGMPEVVLPFHDRASGITTGLGIMGPRYSDAKLCQLLISISGQQRIVEI